MLLLVVKIMDIKISIFDKGRAFMDTPKFFFTNEYRKFRPLLKQYSCSERFYPKGDTVFSSETDLDFCLYIDRGLVAYSILHDSGAQKLLFYHGEGSLFPTYKSPKTYAIGEIAYAITDVTGFVISQANLQHLIDRNIDFTKCVLNNYLEMFNFLIFDIMNQCHNTSYVRVCNLLYLYLESRRKTEPSACMLYITQDELAQFIGVSRVQVSNVFKTLRDEGILENARGKVKILDVGRLKENCSSEII